LVWSLLLRVKSRSLHPMRGEKAIAFQLKSGVQGVAKDFSL